MQLFGFILFLGVGLIVKAQSGEISGCVRNQNALRLKAVHITVVDSMGTALGKATQTDNYGNYNLARLMPGVYSLKYVCKGYSSALISGIVVNPDKTTFVDMKMNALQNAAPAKKRK